MSIQRNYWNQESETFQKIYSRQKSKISKLLDRIFRIDMFQRFEFTIQHSEPIKNKTFLDVGCGSGLYSIEFAKRGASGVLGIDIAENMIDLCKKFALQNKVTDKCTFIKTDLLQYNSESVFDISIGIGLFDYIYDPLPVIQKMKEITKVKVIISFPKLLTWRAPIRKLRLFFRGCEVHFYTKNRIKRLMKSTGFLSYKLYKVGKLYCVVGFSDNQFK
jgi:2-polyprenyl-3-methyl-5-hydroxy-6-metoxy-1,4-benzoquinol methylase